MIQKMGIYLNPGNENFSRSLRNDIYVDKTMMLASLNRFIEKGNNYICVSRPRRFGKTVTQNMIAAYYSRGCNSGDLFKGLKIENTPSFKSYLNRFNVIQIDLNGEYESARAEGTAERTIDYLLVKIKREFRSQFQDISFYDNDTLADMMLRVYSEKKETFVFLIDEYDVLVREEVTSNLFDQYMSFLNSVFKNNTLRPALSLAYITGILPVVRDKVQSKLNNFKEYTILDARELTEYVGFTSDEVKHLCAVYNRDFQECKLWYDGYRQNGYDLYNPESVVESVLSGYFSSYWGKTSSYTVVSDRIRSNFKGMRDDVTRMLAGEKIPVDADRYMNTMSDFKTKDDAFTYLIHTGYLSYNLESRTCQIPNNEIRKEWIRAVSDNANYHVTDQIISASHLLLKETWEGKEEAVAKALDISHINVTSNRSYNNEDALQSAIYLAYIDALNEYTVIKEMTAGKGFADLTYIPVKKTGHPAMIIELKHNKTAESAITQIRQKHYFDSLAHYAGNLIFVGINYDEKDKKHTCRIEQFRKDALSPC